MCIRTTLSRTLYDIVVERVSASLNTVERICDAFEITPAELFAGPDYEVVRKLPPSTDTDYVV